MANVCAAGPTTMSAVGAYNQASDAGTGSSQLVFTGSKDTTTSFVYCTAHTITSTHVIFGVYLMAKYLGGGGTCTIELNNGTVAVETTTINAADIPTDQTLIFIQFPTQYTSTGLTTMKIGVKTSVGGTVRFYDTGSAGNLFRLYMRFNTAATLAASDTRFHAKYLTGQGTSNSCDMTMDHTVSTVWTGTWYMGLGGNITWANTAGIGYQCRISGTWHVFSGATIDMYYTSALAAGTTGIFYTGGVSTAVHVYAGGTWRARSATKTRWHSLASSASIGATSLSLAASPTAWASGDTVGITSRAFSATHETRTMSGAASGSSAPINATTKDKTFINGYGSEVMNLTTSGFSLQSTVNTNFFTFTIDDGAVFYEQYVSHDSMAAYAIGIGANGSFTADSCSYNGTGITDGGFNITAANSANITISNNACWLWNYFVKLVATSASSDSFTGNLCQGAVAGDAGGLAQLGDNGITFTGNYMVGGVAYGIVMSEGQSISGSYDNNVCHSCQTRGLRMTNNFSGTITTLTCWECGVYGLEIATGSTVISLNIANYTAFGHSTANCLLTTGYYVNCRFTGWILNSSSLTSTPRGVQLTGTTILNDVLWTSCTFGVTVTHSTADFEIGATSVYPVRTGMNSCTLASTTEVNGQGNLPINFYIFSDKHDNTTGEYRAWFKYGSILNDTSIFGTASPSLKMIPSNASNKLFGEIRQIPVDNTKTVTVSVKVRKSAVSAGDATTYNGNQIRLVAVANPAIGISSDTVVASSTSAANGAFETISGALPVATGNGVVELRVDCDGTTGFANVDDWSVTEV